MLKSGEPPSTLQALQLEQQLTLRVQQLLKDHLLPPSTLSLTFSPYNCTSLLGATQLAKGHRAKCSWWVQCLLRYTAGDTKVIASALRREGIFYHRNSSTEHNIWVGQLLS